MEEKLENTLRFYVLATQLKYKIRSGWDDIHWNISGERRESIAEHIYGTCILAIALDSEFKTDLDLEKVIMMLVLHELGEVLIGDITPFDNIPREQKIEIEFKAIREVLGDLQKNEEYYDLLKEFDQKKTKEAVFSFALLSKYVFSEGKHASRLLLLDRKSEQDDNVVFRSSKVQEMARNGAETAFDIWYEWDKSLYQDDENFLSLLDYVRRTDTQKII